MPFLYVTANTLKDKAAQKKHLCEMLKNMTAEEQKWLIRIIMKELKMGLSQQSVFSVFHQDAEDLFNVKMSLEKVRIFFNLFKQVTTCRASVEFLSYIALHYAYPHMKYFLATFFVSICKDMRKMNDCHLRPCSH